MQEAVIEVPPTLEPLTAALTDGLAGAAATAGSLELQVRGMLVRTCPLVSMTVASIVLEVPLLALMIVPPTVLTESEIDWTGHVVKSCGLLLLFPTDAKT